MSGGGQKVDYKWIWSCIYILSFLCGPNQKLENKIFKIKLKLKTYLSFLCYIIPCTTIEQKFSDGLKLETFWAPCLHGEKVPEHLTPAE